MNIRGMMLTARKTARAFNCKCCGVLVEALPMQKDTCGSHACRMEKQRIARAKLYQKQKGKKANG